MKEKKVKRFLVITLITIMSALNISAINVSYTPDVNIGWNYSYSNNDSILRLDLIENVNKYIQKRFKLHDEKLPEYLVDYSIEYDIDLCFMMAQTNIETAFGTTGVGRSTSRYSLFGVCKGYNSYEEAINDYCNLLKKSYLGQTKTVYDLMRRYVTLRGARYASNPRYEQHLSSTYKLIKNNTNIYDMWMKLRKKS